MVRLATSVISIALLAIPVLAASSSEQYERSVSESELYGRDIIEGEDIMLAREDLVDMFGREFIDDIEERSPWGLGLLFKGVKAAVKVGKKAHQAHEAKQHAQNSYNNHRNRREFDDDEVYQREFDDEEMLERGFEDEDLLEREYFDELD